MQGLVNYCGYYLLLLIVVLADTSAISVSQMCYQGRVTCPVRHRSRLWGQIRKGKNGWGGGKTSNSLCTGDLRTQRSLEEESGLWDGYRIWLKMISCSYSSCLDKWSKWTSQHPRHARDLSEQPSSCAGWGRWEVVVQNTWKVPGLAKDHIELMWILCLLLAQWLISIRVRQCLIQGGRKVRRRS